MDDDEKFTEARLTLVGNGYIITVSNGSGLKEGQYVARDLDQVADVLKSIMKPPAEGEA